MEHAYALFKEPALNSAHPTFIANLAALGHPAERSISLPARRLDSILREHLTAGEEITFLSVDVEGLDLQVLRSNDWRMFRPELVLVEAGVDLRHPLRSRVVQYMAEQGYILRSYLHLTAVFERQAVPSRRNLLKLKLPRGGVFRFKAAASVFFAAIVAGAFLRGLDGWMAGVIISALACAYFGNETLRRVRDFNA